MHPMFGLATYRRGAWLPARHRARAPQDRLFRHSASMGLTSAPGSSSAVHALHGCSPSSHWRLCGAHRARCSAWLPPRAVETTL